MATLYTVTVDTEEEWDWDAGWPTDNLAVTNIACLPDFQQRCARHGAAVTYFTNYAVMNDAVARETMRTLAQQPGVEVGMHIHPWNTPPLDYQGPVAARETFIHNLPAELAVAKLKTVYERFRDIGLTPTSFRGGRYSSGPVMHRFLQTHGFVADASVVPYTTWADDGAPDYRHRTVFPARLPPAGPDGPALWEIPLSYGFTRRPFAFWGSVYHQVERSALRHLRLLGLADRLGLVRKAWLNLESPLSGNMLVFLRQLQRMGVPCVNFTLHSSSLVPGGSPYTRTPADRERLLARIDEVLAALAQWQEFQPATMTETAAHLEREYARTRH